MGRVIVDLTVSGVFVSSRAVELKPLVSSRVADFFVFTGIEHSCRFPCCRFFCLYGHRALLSVPLLPIFLSLRALRTLVGSPVADFFVFTGTETPCQFPCCRFFCLYGHREPLSVPLLPIFLSLRALRTLVNSRAAYFSTLRGRSIITPA